MILQESLIKRIEEHIEKIKRQKKIKDIDLIEYEVRMAKKTNSIYITVWTFLGEEKYRKIYRLSDHYNSKIKTKVVQKATNFEFIAKRIKEMIVSILTARHRDLINNFDKDVK